MKTSLLITIEHPDEASAKGFIEHAVKPVLKDLDRDSDGWSVNIEGESELRDRALRTALALALSDFPDEWSTTDIIEGILNHHGDILVWQPFEYWDAEEIVNHIEETAIVIYDTYL